MGFDNKLKKYGLEKAVDYIYKDPESNMLKLMDFADKIAGDELEGARRKVREVMQDKDHPYHGFILRILRDLDKDTAKSIAVNFFINSILEGWNIQQEIRKKNDFNVPWTILMDPTTACNLKCKGCWASEYGHALNLSYDEIDNIIKQGKELGVYFYIYTGGEPLVRKDDLIKICKKHNDCVFLCFTNGTLIDEEFAKTMLSVKNFVPAISLEGSRESTDKRRGEGTYDKVIDALKILKKYKLLYGISTCYTRDNYNEITSEEYFDKLIDLGAYFVWFFHFMPVGKNTSKELLPSAEQRREVYRRIREQRSKKPIFMMDFQNDAEFVNGCIAGGRRYLHINANGDYEPCVFIHYSDSNIKDKTLIEALKSPMLMEYKKSYPFNENMLRPCPMLENPKKLRAMVKRADAHSTDILSKENVDDLCSKCDEYAEKWKAISEELFYNEK